MTIKTLVEFAQAVEDGHEIERLINNWASFEARLFSVDYIVELIDCGHLRIKQGPKKIDLSFLCGSGIDCEFKVKGQIGYPVIGELASIQSGEYELLNGAFWHHCRPRMNHWHSPLNSNLCGVWNVISNAGFVVEKATDIEGVVTDFKITGIKEGYTL